MKPANHTIGPRYEIQYCIAYLRDGRCRQNRDDSLCDIRTVQHGVLSQARLHHSPLDDLTVREPGANTLCKHLAIKHIM